MSAQVQPVVEAIAKVKAAHADLHVVARSIFPIGEPIRWKKNGHWQYGTVVSHGGVADRLRVKNGSSQRQYWITLYDVVGYVEPAVSK